MLSHRSLQLPDNSGVIICASATRFPQSGLVQRGLCCVLAYVLAIIGKRTFLNSQPTGIAVGRMEMDQSRDCGDRRSRIRSSSEEAPAKRSARYLDLSREVATPARD
jgi:hypothetical protein